uniref:Laminin EGF-like domain-containing protein n=1 Tax=Syphacia muris TaxID=451379 RepID=A0A0N5AJ01_9BILA
MYSIPFIIRACDSIGGDCSSSRMACSQLGGNGTCQHCSEDNCNAATISTISKSGTLFVVKACYQKQCLQYFTVLAAVYSIYSVQHNSLY